MSKYTTELRYIIESGFPLGLDTYPIFEESYREPLNQKIKDHFYFREIGFETAGLFKNRLNVKMNEIMPYYNQLYMSQLKKISPLLTQAFTEKYIRATDSTGTTETSDSQNIQGSTTGKKDQKGSVTQTTEGDGSKTSSETGHETTEYADVTTQKTVFSDTPQSLLSDVDINREIYATNATLQNGTVRHEGDVDNTLTSKESTMESSTSTSQTTDGSTYSTTDKKDITGMSEQQKKELAFEEFTRDISGFTGTSQAKLLMEWRESFLNIDMLIIDELEELFMALW